jgi:hypothetical protein
MNDSILTKIVDIVLLSNVELTTSMIGKSYSSSLCMSNDRLSFVYDDYYKSISTKWDKMISDTVNNSNCNAVRNKINVSIAKDIIDKYNMKQLSIPYLSASYIVNNKLKNVSMKDIFNEDMFITLRNTLKVLIKYSGCDITKIFNYIIGAQQMYFDSHLSKLSTAVNTNTNTNTSNISQQMVAFVENEYNTFLDKLAGFVRILSSTEIPTSINTNSTASKLDYDDSTVKKYIAKELDSLIPDSLGSMKEFFITIISSYYSSLHPVVYCQIFKNIIQNYGRLKNAPITTASIYSYIAREILLGSGPFILKMLQTIRPVMSKDILDKYDLTTLKYPLLSVQEVDILMRDSIHNNILSNLVQLANVSASIGHVVIVKDKRTNVKSVIKFIKPLSICQSCWEYNTLVNNVELKDEESRNFVKSMLSSTAEEMNTRNEIENINLGYKYYTASYNTLFNINNGIRMETIRNITNIVKPNKWYCLAMTFATGFPLSKIQESTTSILSDTDYLKLWRALDILVYKFFHTLIFNSFYHADLHAGNLYFDPDNNLLTIIDFGSVGRINVFKYNDNRLLSAIIVGLNGKYDELLDYLTEMINDRLNDNTSRIDMSSKKYHMFKNEMIEMRMSYENMREERSVESSILKEKIFNKDEAKEEYNLFNNSFIYSIFEKKNSSRNINESNINLRSSTTNSSNKNSFSDALEKIFIFYSNENNINVATIFEDIYSLQKSYTMILGLLSKLNYSPSRMSIIISYMIQNSKADIVKLLANNPSVLLQIVDSY